MVSEGFTATTERLGNQRAQEVLRAHNAVVREQVAAHRDFELKSDALFGQEVKPTGAESGTCWQRIDVLARGWR